MFEISYWSFFALTVFIYIAVRIIKVKLNKETSIVREVKSFFVFVSIVVIVRIVYFPWHHVNGHIGTLKFDISRIFPLWINYIPIVHLFDSYAGWLMNIIGNIAMFIPIGIIWPSCIAKLNSIKKTIAAGAAFSLLIEITQLLFYERCSDIDDLLLNTIGVTIGAVLYFMGFCLHCKIKSAKCNSIQAD